MRAFGSTILLRLAVAGCATRGVEVADHASSKLEGTWVLSLENTKGETVTTAKIKFQNSEADSCIDGDWRKVLVVDFRTSDQSFFPLDEPISYTMDGDELVIGRNSICDDYLRRRGKVLGTTIEGDYFAFGFGHSNDLGRFTLHRKGSK